MGHVPAWSSANVACTGGMHEMSTLPGLHLGVMALAFLERRTIKECKWRMSLFSARSRS